MMQLLKRGFDKYDVDTDLQHHLRDVEDHVERLISRADSFRDILQNALTLDGTLTANRQNEASAEQNEQVKKISSWAAIFFAPSFVAGVYGMNFDHMPELHWAFGYPLAILMMAATAGLMYTIFKRKGWL
jgi:magnesium transporter